MQLHKKELQEAAQIELQRNDPMCSARASNTASTNASTTANYKTFGGEQNDYTFTPSESGRSMSTQSANSAQSIYSSQSYHGAQ